MARMLAQTPGPLGKPAAKALEGLARQVEKIDFILQLFAPFTLEQKGPFSCANTHAAYARLSAEDRAALPWYPEKIDWADYWMNQHMPAMEKRVLPWREEKDKKELAPLNRLLAQASNFRQVDAVPGGTSASGVRVGPFGWRAERRWTSADQLLQPLAEAIGDEAYEVRVTANMLLGFLLPFLGLLDEAEERLDRTSELCREKGDELHLAGLWNNRSCLWIARNDRERFMRDNERVLEFARRMGNAHLERGALFEWQAAAEAELASSMRPGHAERASRVQLLVVRDRWWDDRTRRQRDLAGRLAAREARQLGIAGGGCELGGGGDLVERQRTRAQRVVERGQAAQRAARARDVRGGAVVAA
jgi:hypothetical protein